MKTNIKIGLLSVIMLGLGLSACDYLDNPVRNETITEDNIWVQKDRIKGVAMVAYASLNRDMYNPIDGGGAMMSQACDEAVNSNTNSSVQYFTNGV